jgi:hypothetical protein
MPYVLGALLYSVQQGVHITLYAKLSATNGDCKVRETWPYITVTQPDSK